MMGIRTSIENILLGCDAKGMRDIGRRLLEGVRKRCLKDCKICKQLVVHTPVGPMPLLLWKLGFRVLDRSENELQKASVAPPPIVLLDYENPSYAIEHFEKQKFYQ